MKIDDISLAFGYRVKTGGATPNWATALGQGKEHKINNDPAIDEILKGVVYSSVPLEKVSTKIGKGGRVVSGDLKESPIVLAAVFSKVYVNDTLILNGKFVLLITRDESESHAGRLRIKYGPSNTYKDGDRSYSNQDFFQMVKQQLSLADDACWFVTDISVVNQNELILKAVVVDPNDTVEYENNAARHTAWIELEPTLFNRKVLFESFKARNRIIFGAPGTGKSYVLNRDRKELLYGNPDIDESTIDDMTQYGYYERVTFHPDYSYANFVGTYKPVPYIDAEGKDEITYSFVPGPFMRVYVEALKNSLTTTQKPHLLIIEEINRANIAAVFGDVFQLLDRGDNEVSEYPIHASEDIKKHLADEVGGQLDNYSELRIPANMFIWATMNSADQGVFPMDTAFKRRWDFTYIGIDDNDADIRGKYVVLGNNTSQKVEWNKLRKAINHFLTEHNINEDKLLGPYFISRKIVVPENGDEIDRETFIETFKNKVLMYLFEDVVKQKPSALFEGCFKNHSRYSQICKEFEEKGIGIFHTDISLGTEPEDLTINGANVHATPEDAEE